MGGGATETKHTLVSYRSRNYDMHIASVWCLVRCVVFISAIVPIGFQYSCLIDMCTMYSDRWRFKYGIEKSKCMFIGKSPFTCEPVWRLNDVSLRNVETREILDNVFNSKGNNTSHVDSRLKSSAGTRFMV